MSNQRYTVFETINGFAGIAGSPKGVTSFSLPAPSKERAEREMCRRAPNAIRAEPSASIVQIIEDVCRYFSGEKIDFWTYLSM